MNTTTKTVLISGGLLAAMWTAIRAFSVKKGAEQLNIRISNPFDYGITSGLDAIQFKINIELENISTEQFTLSLPSIRIFYKSKFIGRSNVNSKVYTILPRNIANINNIQIKLFLKEIVDNNFLTDVKNNLSKIKSMMKDFKLYLLLEVNGIPLEITRGLSGNNIPGLGLVAKSERIILSKKDYVHLIKPESQLLYKDAIVIHDATVEDTVAKMNQIVERYHSDVTKLAQELKGKTVRETSENIWNFIYRYIRYVRDDSRFEQLRRPLRTLYDQQGDCDCFSILAGSMLYSLGIPFFFRITKYNGHTEFQHVYVVVPRGSKEIIIDAVVDSFDYQKPYSGKKDFSTMSLNGIPLQFLNGTGDTPSSKINYKEITDLVLSGIGCDNCKSKTLSGDCSQVGCTLGAIESDKAVYDYLVKTRLAISKNPQIIMAYQKPADFIKMLDMAIQYWNTPKRGAILTELAKTEDKLISQNQINIDNLSGLDDGYDYFIDGLGRVSRKQRKAKRKGRRAARKVKRLNRRKKLLKAFVPGAAKALQKRKKVKVSSRSRASASENQEVVSPADAPDFDYKEQINTQQEAQQAQQDTPDIQDNAVQPEQDTQVQTDEGQDQSNDQPQNDAEPQEDGGGGDEPAEGEELSGFFKTLGKKTKGFFKTDLKNIGKAIVKFSPLTVAARQGILLAFKTNMKGIADKVKAGYLTEVQAKKKGMTTAAWQEGKNNLAKAEKFFADKMQGSRKALRNAILSGNRKGYVNGLGILPAAALAAATPFIIALLDMFKGKKAEESSSTTSESSDTSTSTEDKTDNSKKDDSADAGDKSGDGIKVVSSGVFNKIGTYVKENPVKTGAMVLGAAYLLSPGFRGKVNGAVGMGKKKASLHGTSFYHTHKRKTSPHKIKKVVLR